MLPVLPRLAYVGDVPPRAISAGPALLYRLFENYPADKLLICEDASNVSDPPRQLAAVEHVRYEPVRTRWLRTCLCRWYGSWLQLRSAIAIPAITGELQRFRAEAVVGIAHGYGWWPAWLAAKRLKLPFHLIVHDHWREFITLHPLFRECATRRFRQMYCGAASRLLISPYMEEQYRRDYGMPGTVIYPSRSRTVQPLGHPPARRAGKTPFTFAYAGGLSSSWVKLAIVRLAHAVAPMGAQLRIYQNLPFSELHDAGLRTANVEIVPFLPVDELHRDLVANADATYLPMSFSADDRSNVEMCFPSKLTDYTSLGRPILINAPRYSTAVQWALNNNCSEIVNVDDVPALRSAAHNLISDQRRCERLGLAALVAGQRDFSPDPVFNIFIQAISEPKNAACPISSNG